MIFDFKAFSAEEIVEIIPQILVSGIAAGGVYGLIALGFVLIYKATSVLNLATGEFMTLGAFVCLTVLTELSAPFGVALFLTMIFARMSRRPNRENSAKTTYRGTNHISHYGHYRACKRFERRHSHDLVSAISNISSGFPSYSSGSWIRNCSFRSFMGFHLRRNLHSGLHRDFSVHENRFSHASDGR